MKKYIFGIDPGKSGGWALAKEGTIERYEIMPLVGGEIHVASIADEIRKIKKSDDVIIVIEKVHSMPHQGVSSTFNFGAGYGKLIGMCQTLGVSFDLVSPQTWKKEVLNNTKKDKDAAIDYVKRLFPRVSLVPERCKKAHDGIADAICIMQWGVLKYGTR